VFTFWLPKLKLVGLKFTAGDGLKPVPLSATFCGLFVALSVRVTLALRLPRAEGVKVRLIIQVALGVSVPGHSLAVIVKSLALVPVRAMLLMFKAAWPLLASVTVCALLVVFTFWLPKLKLLGL